MNHISLKSKHQVISKYNQFGMADVTMLLLLFFLLTYNFSVQSTLKVNLPRAESETEATPEAYLTVVVTDQDQILIKDQAVVPENLLTVLNGAKEGMEKIVIRADKNAHHGPVTQVMSAAAALKMRVAIATESPDEGGQP